MIMMWNRKEVFTGSSLELFNEVRRKLNHGNIKHKFRTVDNSRNNRAGSGSFGENLDAQVTYYIYVHRDDYERAVGSLR
jgi:hypothetical protein